MGEAIGQSLPLAVGIALSPLPIVAVVLMLVSKRAKVNGPAFVVGWLVGLAIVGAVVLSIAGPADAADEGDPATWMGVVKLVLGVLLLLVGWREWRGRPKEGDVITAPVWMGAIDEFSPVKAFGISAVRMLMELADSLERKAVTLAIAHGSARSVT